MKKDEKSYNDIKQTLLDDFWCELDKVDFSDYRPDSQKFMFPTTIGMLYLVLDHIDEKSSVEEEIDGAENYLRLYKETQEPAYHTMAGDELKHAKFLLGKTKQKHPDEDYSEYERHIMDIQGRL